MKINQSVFNKKQIVVKKIDADEEKPQNKQPIIQKERVNLYVPFDYKDNAKVLGAKWDMVNKTWYTFRTDNNEDIQTLIDEYHKINFNEKIVYGDKIIIRNSNIVTEKMRNVLDAENKDIIL